MSVCNRTTPELCLLKVEFIGTVDQEIVVVVNLGSIRSVATLALEILGD